MKNAKFKSVLITASICALLFTGCGSKSQNSTNYPNNTKAPNMANNYDNTSNDMSGKNNQTGKTAQQDQAAIKTLYSQTLEQLVTAKKITKTQSDKVLSTLTQNMSQGQMGTSDQGQMGTPNQGQMGTSYGTSSNNMDLNSLVKSKVITQEQSNMINQKIQEAMKNMQTK